MSVFRMDTYIFKFGIIAGFLIISALTATERQSPELTFSPANTDEIKVGTTVNITCDFFGVARFDLARIYRRYGGESQEIVSNEHIDDHFVDEESGKYSVAYFKKNRKTKTAKLILQIKDVEGKDGGNFVCYHSYRSKSGGVESLEAIEYMQVLVPPKSLKLKQMSPDFSWSELSENNVVTLVEGQTGGILCEVASAFTEEIPVVSISLGDQDMMPKFESEFVQDREQLLDGYIDIARTDSLKWTLDNPDRAFTGQNLTCSAKLPGFDPLSKTVSLDVHYLPEVECMDTHAVVQSKDVSLTCTVRGNPESECTWKEGPDVFNSNTTLDVRYGKEKDEVIFTYTINEATPQSFGAMTVTFENSVGVVEAKVSLIEKVITTTEEPTTTTEIPTTITEYKTTTEYITTDEPYFTDNSTLEEVSSDNSTEEITPGVISSNDSDINLSNDTNNEDDFITTVTTNANEVSLSDEFITTVTTNEVSLSDEFITTVTANEVSFSDAIITTITTPNNQLTTLGQGYEIAESVVSDDKEEKGDDPNMANNIHGSFLLKFLSTFISVLYVKLYIFS